MNDPTPTPTRITDADVERARDAMLNHILCDWPVDGSDVLVVNGHEAMRAALEDAALPPAPAIDRDAWEAAKAALKRAYHDLGEVSVDEAKTGGSEWTRTLRAANADIAIDALIEPHLTPKPATEGDANHE